MEPITIIFTYNRCARYKYGGVAMEAGRATESRGMTVPGRQFFYFQTTSASHEHMGELTTTGAHRRIQHAPGRFLNFLTVRPLTTRSVRVHDVVDKL